MSAQHPFSTDSSCGVPPMASAGTPQSVWLDRREQGQLGLCPMNRGLPHPGQSPVWPHDMTPHRAVTLNMRKRTVN